MFILRITFILIFSACTGVLIAQNVAIEQWRDHLSYKNAIAVTESNSQVFCATQKGIIVFNKEDNSIDKLSKANGLSAIRINTIAYHDNLEILVIAYEDGNIDLMQNGTFYNITDIKRSSLIGSKIINQIDFDNDLAYLSCGYGVSVLDLTKREIINTFFLSEQGSLINVNDFLVFGKLFFAASSDGIYFANSTDNNLSFFGAWKKINPNLLPSGNYNLIALFNDKIIVNRSIESGADTIYEQINGIWEKVPIEEFTNHSFNVKNDNLLISHDNTSWVYNKNWGKIGQSKKNAPQPKHSILGKQDNVLWIADNDNGLIKATDFWIQKIILPNGPNGNFAFAMDASNNGIVAVPGGKSLRGGNYFRSKEIYTFSEGTWTSRTTETHPDIKNLFSMVDVKIDPTNSQHLYIASLGGGIGEIDDQNDLTTIYDDENSSLFDEGSSPGWNYVGVAGIDLDNEGNLWAINSLATYGLHVRIKETGQWQSFSVNGLDENSNFGPLVISPTTGHKWVGVYGQGIVVFNDNGTLTDLNDDTSIQLSGGKGFGNLHSLFITCITEDRQGQMWVGTTEGITVFSSPSGVFESTSRDAQQILIRQNGFNEFLLENEIITAIAVDGANRKWIGTVGSGVFLVSADGTEELLNFSKENSPLFSNNIESITIHPKTGEVFFGTIEGLISYRGDATEGGETYDDVYAFPNPVDQTYTGKIAITGLIGNARTKITDISGNLIFETTALGGQAIWDGHDFSGERAQSGIYLVFTSDDNGGNRLVTKILIR